jgi:hypothetical protein
VTGIHHTAWLDGGLLEAFAALVIAVLVDQETGRCRYINTFGEAAGSTWRACPPLAGQSRALPLEFATAGL